MFEVQHQVWKLNCTFLAEEAWWIIKEIEELVGQETFGEGIADEVQSFGLFESTLVWCEQQPLSYFQICESGIKSLFFAYKRKDMNMMVLMWH